MKKTDSSYFNMDSFKEDNIRAVDAKFEAQKIAFAPLCFQAVRAMLELGLLKAIEDSGDDGISRKELAQKTGVSEYGAGVLCEMMLGMNVIKLAKQADEERFVIGKTGWMLLEDDLTKVNFWFTNDICYQGAWDLTASVKNGKPEGLKVFGDKWTTVYEALSTLPEKAKKCRRSAAASAARVARFFGFVQGFSAPRTGGWPPARAGCSPDSPRIRPRPSSRRSQSGSGPPPARRRCPPSSRGGGPPARSSR